MKILLQLFQGPKGKLSHIRFLCVLWYLYIIISGMYLLYTTGSYVDFPKSYFEISMVLSGTYTVKRYMEGKDSGLSVTETK